MKILIVGGGIGGLAVAGFLEKKGFDVTLVEQAPQFKHIGFNISIAGNGRRLLHDLGIDDEIAKEGYELPWVELADSKGKRLGPRLNFHKLKEGGAPQLLSIERANLHENLVKNLTSTKVLLGTTITDFHNTKDGVRVNLSNGKKEEFDLMIAADGIRSKIREEIFGKDESHFYGWSFRIFLVPPHIPYPKGALCISKTGITLAFYPTKDKCSVGMYEYNPGRLDRKPLEIDGFLPYLKQHGWTEKHIKDLQKEAEDGHQYYDHLRHIRLGPWYKKRVVFLGDSRHGVSPISGMGGSMAIEDAFVLADELSKVDVANIPLALKNYSKRRTRRLRQVMSLSSFAEKFYFIKSPFGKFVRDLVVRCTPALIFQAKMRKIIYGFL